MKNKIIITSLFSLLFYSCKLDDCKSLADSYRKTKCNIIVKEIPKSTSLAYFKLKGKNLETGNDTIHEEENRWFCSFYKYIEVGDTIIKKKNELIFSIHKKDTTLNFDWECDGKKYK
jgi:hypothetical protein